MRGDDTNNQTGDKVEDEIQQTEGDQSPEANPEPEPVTADGDDGVKDDGDGAGEVKPEEVKAEQKAEEPKPDAKQQRKPRGPNRPKVQVPTIGRIVHYVTSAGTIRPAIITLVSEEAVDLTVFNSQGAVAVDTVSFDNELPGETPGTVFWPEIN